MSSLALLPSEGRSAFPGSITGRKRNVHIIMLESFVDPRLLSGLAFDRSPLYEGLAGYINPGARFDLIESPVYGGSSAQADFEILGGAPALSLVSSVEFNVLEGYAMDTFASALKRNGYQTIVTLGEVTGFYNSRLAFKSLGFESIHFLNENGYFHKSKLDQYIFDGDLLLQNLKHVFEANDDRPMLNYIRGMYGHYPFPHNPTERPDLIPCSSKKEHLCNITNQFYYRTKAIYEFIAQLSASDPDAIVLIASDHLPSILSGDIKYAEKETLNIGLLLDRFHKVDVNHRKYYELPYIIWSLLTEEKLNIPRQAELEERYYLLLSQGMGISPRSGDNIDETASRRPAPGR
jgi:phosphoglycerol transferase MdoB-like AlkP superfamily enzyme